MSEPRWSVSETEVLREAGAVLEEDRNAVLATIIDVEGSAYRRPGAKMVIPEEGGGFGHITAGCLEDEVERLAEEVLASGERRIVTYDLRPSAEEDVWGLGVGCNGVIDILLEPLDDSFRPVIAARGDRRGLAMITVIETIDQTPITTRTYYDPASDRWEDGKSIPAAIRHQVQPVATELVRDGQSTLIEVKGKQVFVDGVRPPEHLVVVGTGHDVQPIVELGTRADFPVTVVGFRGAAATSDRFPHADRVVSTSPARIHEAVPFDDNTYVVVATHNFIDDRLSVERLLQTPVPYIGLMGPTERFEQMLREFDDPSPNEIDRSPVYTPVGLDLGGGSPHQIAISIIAEVLAVVNGRAPRHLSDREGPIHDRADVAVDDVTD